MSTASASAPAPIAPSLRLQVITLTSLALAIAIFFWTDSRYPSLLKKLHSGTSLHLSGALSFDALLPVTAGMPTLTRIERTSVNWMWTNRVGMSFGIFFGAAVLTLLPLLPRRRFRGAMANTLLGAAAGAPLGVCANCVAPIGRGLYAGGADSRTTLATMISSPMLNVVVLTMAFALLPLPLALLRLAVPVMLLALVPLMASSAPAALDVSCATPAAGLRASLFDYLKNFGRLAVYTVPLMAVAAVLGAMVIELLPPSSFPAHVSLWGILLVAVIGVFLPVPIAFDVAMAFVLLAKGVPLPYVVALLCTLGAYSIYSFFILGRSMSWRVAGKFFAVVAVIGAAAGTITALIQHSY